MKKLIVGIALIVLAGCGKSDAQGRKPASDKQLRLALAHTNAALTESQDRAARYQKGYEKLAREKHHIKKK